MTSARTRQGEPEIRVQVLKPEVNGILYPPTGNQEHPARSTAPREECEYVKYHRPRNRPRALRGSASVIGGTGRRRATSAQPGNPREPRLREVAGKATWTTGQLNASTAFFIRF